MQDAAPLAPANLAPAVSGKARAHLVLLSLGLLCLLCLMLSCALGSVRLSPAEVVVGISELLQGQNNSMAATLLELRLNRALAGFLNGAMLALAGVMMQALLRNPLADPYVLGVSGGAAVAALMALLLAAAAWMVDVAAFGGAMVVAGLLFMLTQRDLRRGMGDGQTPILLLTGVIVSAGCGAIITLLLSIAPDGQLRGMVFWMVGDLSGAHVRWLSLAILFAVYVFAQGAARSINLIAVHAEAAASLGVKVGALRQRLFLGSALLTAAAVSSAGSIGFVGLIVPHACRFALGADHRLLLPAASLVGGCFLMLADTVARTLLAPQQLPVGVITALIGVPVFLIQLHHVRKH